MIMQFITTNAIRIVAAINKILRLLESGIPLSASFILGRKKCRAIFTPTANIAAITKMKIVDKFIRVG